ncbi:hypothetical protein DFH08DRAFT_682438 [Mycena albidolilacea]|uniref:Uncharacterized protein n=1 Tax=Mycena albidolilacea TaxID=1033008 RepID=A0AAD7F2Q0_9AGAR|nr:hypothetical protein DFH08DRAFT_682438 [Mycena albidolilacea]
MGRGWGLNWAMCVVKYFDFESAWGFVMKGGQLGRPLRPQQVAGWLSRGRRWMLPPTLGSDLGTRTTDELWVGLWWTWWASLQPKERAMLENKEPFQPEDADWSKMVGQYSDNGLLQVMATLLWWGEVVQKREAAEQDQWLAAVKDVMWVLDQLLESERIGR